MYPTSTYQISCEFELCEKTIQDQLLHEYICLIPSQYLLVELELNFVNKFATNTVSGRVLFARYISVPITLWYETSDPKTLSFGFLGRNGSFSTISDRTIISVVSGLYKMDQESFMSKLVDELIFLKISVPHVYLNKIMYFQYLSYKTHFSNN